MIRLTRLNNQEFVLNAELIMYVETTPDTVITLVNREKVIVLEHADEVVKRAVAFARSVRSPLTGQAGS